MSDNRICPNKCREESLEWGRNKDVNICSGNHDISVAVQCWWCPVCGYSEVEEYY